MNVRLSDADKVKLLNSDDVYAVMQKILLRENKIERNKERFWMIGLATNNRILYIELISVGSVRTVHVEPMEVFSIALQKRSVNVIMVHNHPSGELKPSKEDVDLTDRLYQIGQFLNVPVLDHLIITERTYLSMLDTGVIEQVKASKRYVLPYKEEERVRAEIMELGMKKGEERRNLELARVMKAKGMSAAIIAEITGLSLSKIKVLKAPKA